MAIDATLLADPPTCFLEESSRVNDGGVVTATYSVGDGRRFLSRSDVTGTRWYQLPNSDVPSNSLNPRRF
jgi:hypothetical protein